MNLSGMSKATLINLSKMSPRENVEKKESELKEACADFESVLLNYMFKSMKNTVGKDGIFGSSYQKDMYESVFFEKIAEEVAREKGMGIGEALYRQLSGEALDAPKNKLNGDDDTRSKKG